MQLGKYGNVYVFGEDFYGDLDDLPEYKFVPDRAEPNPTYDQRQQFDEDINGIDFWDYKDTFFYVLDENQKAAEYMNHSSVFMLI